MKRRHLTALTVAIIIAFMTALTIWLGIILHRAKVEAVEWQDAHSAAKIVGKTADQIVAIYGKPDSSERGPDGKLDNITYKDARGGQDCGISIQNAVATDVYFWAQ